MIRLVIWQARFTANNIKSVQKHSNNSRIINSVRKNSPIREKIHLSYGYTRRGTRYILGLFFTCYNPFCDLIGSFYGRQHKSCSKINFWALCRHKLTEKTYVEWYETLFLVVFRAFLDGFWVQKVRFLTCWALKLWNCRVFARLKDIKGPNV